MKLAMTLLVKNEIDIIKTHVEYHLPKVDYLVVMDNLSTDGTLEYLRSMGDKNDNLYVLSVASNLYSQNDWVPRMVSYAINLGADWIVNSDADEFYIGDLKGAVQEAYNEGYNQVYPKGSTFYMTVRDPIYANPVKRMIYRDPLSVKYENDKVIHSTVGFEGLSQGNHWVLFNKIITSKILQTDKIRLFHYPERDFEQFSKKYAGKFDEIKISQMGNVWKLRHEVYRREGINGLNKLFLETCLLSDDKMKEKGLERDTLLSEEILLKERGAV
jgi:glycosyltransferase involved in cell wall biosynthesis